MNTGLIQISYKHYKSDLSSGYGPLSTNENIGVRAGGPWGAAAPPPPPKILGNSGFLGSKREL